MINKIEHLIPNEVHEIYQFSKSLMESKDEWKYRFVPEEKFIEIDDLRLQAKIYWEEILYRAHIACLLSLFKNRRWLQAMENNYDNYYGFCSSLRGLIESCADSFYTLQTVPLTIAKDFEVISRIVKSNSEVVITHDKLEKRLLHFIQATKLNSSQKKELPSEFSANQICEYIASIDDKSMSVDKLYRYLCGISHPSYEATQLFLFLEEGETIVCSDSHTLEVQLLESLLKAHKPVIQNLFRTFFGNIYCVINLLNQFQIDSIFTPVDHSVIERYPPWNEINDYIVSSALKYKEAIKSGVYD